MNTIRLDLHTNRTYVFNQDNYVAFPMSEWLLKGENLFSVNLIKILFKDLKSS